jgi:hypothetical protein
MSRIYNFGAWACNSAAVALIAFALLAVPTNRVLADDETDIAVPPSCIICACPNNIPPCFTKEAGDLVCVVLFNNCNQCPRFEGTWIPLCFCA